MGTLTAGANQRFWTIGQLARWFNKSTDQISYAVEQYGIEPATRIGGITRVWSDDQLPAIQSALARVTENRKGW